MSKSPPNLQNTNHKLSQKEARDILWNKGILHWKLHKGQKEMYEMVKNNDHPVIVIGCSRQLGKSFFLTLFAIEECLKNPNIIVKFVAPKAKNIRGIIAPLIREITSDAAKEIRPKFNSRDNTYRFHNGSEIQLAGTDNGHAESLRGIKAHLCIIDEAGFCDDLNYVVDSILLPTMTRTRGKLVMASTPSRSPDHPFMGYFDEAESEGRLIRKTIYDNPQLTLEEIDRLAEALGGKDSADFRREYLVERIIKEEDAVVPEFDKDLREKVIKEVQQRPAFFDSYVSMDIGGKDMTAVLFAYYDFALATIVIEDEYIAKGQVLTDEIALNIRKKEAELWTGKTGEVKPPALRVSDNNNIILLNDLATKHGITFVPTLKDNADAALNNMRMLLKAGRIIINPKCKTLIHHLQSATWNKARNSYTRPSDKSHHYDTIDALIYLCRNINTLKNPFPPGYQFNNPGSLFLSDPNSTKAKSGIETHLENAFKVKKIGRFKRY